MFLNRVSTARLKMKIKLRLKSSSELTEDMKHISLIHLFCCINFLYEPELSQEMADWFIIMGIAFVKHVPVVHYMLYLSFVPLKPDFKYFFSWLINLPYTNVCKNSVFLQFVSTICFVVVMWGRIISFLIGEYQNVNSTFFFLMYYWASLNVLLDSGNIQNRAGPVNEVKYVKTFSHAQTTGKYLRIAFWPFVCRFDHQIVHFSKNFVIFFL